MSDFVHLMATWPTSLNGPLVVHEARALVIVRVPDADAASLDPGYAHAADGARTCLRIAATGARRNYNYEIRARSRDGNQIMDQTRNVAIGADQQVNVDFSRSAKNK